MCLRVAVRINAHPVKIVHRLAGSPLMATDNTGQACLPSSTTQCERMPAAVIIIRNSDATTPSASTLAP